jgi:hypothetical protein
MALTGYTEDSDFPTTSNALQPENGGGIDTFLVVVDIDGFGYSTYIGNEGYDSQRDVVMDRNGTVFIVGSTNSDEFYTSRGAFDTTRDGPWDVYVIGISMDFEPPLAVAGDDVVVDQHEIVSFNGTASSDNVGIVNWTWSFEYGGKVLEAYYPQTSFRFDEAGIYTVYLNVSDRAGNQATDNLTVTVRDTTRPIVNAGGNRTVNQHEIVTLDGSSSRDNTGIASAAWSFEYRGVPTVLEDLIAKFTFDDIGTFEITLNLTDLRGNWATDTVVITVLDGEPPTAEAGPDIQAEYGVPTQLNGTGSSDNVGVVNWTWDFLLLGERTVIYGSKPELTFLELGEFVVNLTVADAREHTSSDSLHVTVRDTNAPVPDGGPDRSVAIGTTVTLDGGNSTDNMGIISYKWTIEHDGSEVVLDGSVASHTFESLGKHNVTLEVTDLSGNLARCRFNVSVFDPTKPEADAGEDLDIDQHGIASFDGSGSRDDVGIANWTWTVHLAAGNITLYGPTPSYLFDEAGEFRVGLTVTDTSGNSAMDEITVLVRDIEPPTAVIDAPRTVRPGAEITLDGSLSDDNVDVVNWSWEITLRGSSEKRYGSLIDYTCQGEGKYTVTLTVTDAEGNTDSSSIPVVAKRDVTEEPRYWIPILVLLIAVTCSVLSIWYLVTRRTSKET